MVCKIYRLNARAYPDDDVQLLEEQYFLGSTLSASCDEETGTLEIEMSFNPGSIQKYKEGEFETEDAMFVLSKQQARVLGEFLISISNTTKILDENNRYKSPPNKP